MNLEMNPQPDLNAVKDALLKCSEMPAEQRAAHLQALAQKDPALAQAVAALLPDALATQAALHAPQRWLSELVGNGLPHSLGPWQVLGEIGRGGMGVVLLAKRADGAFEKEVAIKVLPPALANAQSAQRFAAEVQMLARLEHPHIARLLDAGFDQGCAYLVMEHVKGCAITHHVQAKGSSGPGLPLPLRPRLQLVLQLCAAVQFAHAQLLVHRDLKPANVMVDSSTGSVRLLDFGIATLLASGENQATRAATLQAGYTPGYASPEQLLGQPVSVASDVFSLGVMLFELLTDELPFSGAAAGLDAAVASADTAVHASLPAAAAAVAAGQASHWAVVRAVLQNEPKRAALHRAGVPADLQAVVLKALQKPVEQRYASVEALASDLRAWLAGSPVQAQAPSWAYSARKFVARHRFAVGGAALASVAVLGFSAWAVISAQQARQQEALAQARLLAVRSIANKVVFDYNRALEPVPGTLEVRKTLVADALTYLNALSSEAAGDRALMADLARGFDAIGDVQGRGVTGGNLGDTEGARSSFEKAAALRQVLCETPAKASPPATSLPASAAMSNADTALTACALLARSLTRLGDNAFTRGKTEEAIAHFDAARAAVDKVLPLSQLGSLANSTPNPEVQQALDARFDASQRLVGLSTRQTGAAYARGLPLAQEQLQTTLAMAAAAPGPKTLDKLRGAQDFMAARWLAEGRADDALPHIQQAVAAARELVRVRPGRDAAVSLSMSLAREAEIQAHRLQSEATRPLLAEALALAQQLHQAEPEDAHLRGRYANIARRFGQVNNQVGDSSALQANANQLPAVLAVSGVFKPSDGVLYLQHQAVLMELARTELALGGPARAELALQHLATFPPSMPTNPRAAADLAEVFVLRAQALLAAGQTAAAQAAWAAGHDALAQTVAATPSNAQAASQLLYARAWAAARPAMAAVLAAPERVALSSAPTLAALQSQGRLTRWWQREIEAAAGVPKP
jgi:eukaryotic-like serine/threonine-protein kinase